MGIMKGPNFRSRSRLTEFPVEDDVARWEGDGGAPDRPRNGPQTNDQAVSEGLDLDYIHTAILALFELLEKQVSINMALSESILLGHEKLAEIELMVREFTDERSESAVGVKPMPGPSLNVQILAYLKRITEALDNR